jgi:sugar O-acyltransferase (sialic acid O-acetyltransferase NeuD family)
MKKIVVCNGGFGREMETYLQDAFPEGSGFALDRIMDLFPEDAFTPAPDEVFVVATGEPAIKARLVTKIEEAGGVMLTVIHPTCYVASSARIGRGSLLCPFAFVGPFAELAPHVTMNVHSGCGHNTRLGSFTVLSPYASLSGAAALGEQVFMGTHSYVAPNKTVGARSKISAGAFALEDVPENSLAVGNPARVLKGYFE